MVTIKKPATTPQKVEGGRMTFVYQVSRLTQGEKGGLDQLVLREYHQPKDQRKPVKALARYYFNWDVPSISGLAVAHQYRGLTSFTVDLEDHLFKVVLPLSKWDSELRRQLKPHKGKILNPKEDSHGVSKFFGIQLHVEVEGNPFVSIEKSQWDGKEYSWEVYQFQPHHIKGVKLISAVEEKFLLPFLKGEEIDFMLAMETKKAKKNRRRRGKNRSDYRNREELETKRRELLEVQNLKENLKEELRRESSSSIRLEIENIEKQIQRTIAEIESLIE